MFYGRFKYSVTLKGIINETGEKGSVNFSMTVGIKDLEHKQANLKTAAGKNKNKKTNKSNQTKNKSDNSQRKNVK